MILSWQAEGKGPSPGELPFPPAPMPAPLPRNPMETRPIRTFADRYDPREIRARRRVERLVESLGERAIELGLDPIGAKIAGPLRVEPDLRARPWIVVLSGGITSKGLLNATTRGRVAWAAELYTRGLGGQLVVSGGPRRPGRPPSGPAMKALAAELGVPAERIQIEGESSRTAENAEEVAQFVRRAGDGSILLVTSPLHMRRALLCFRKQGIEVGPAPAPGIEGEPPERASALSQALHEYIGLVYYRFRGWI